jgi:hypothetical protein
MQTARDRYPNIQAVPNGSKLNFKVSFVGRDADTFTIRDRNRTDYQVLITDRTSIKTYGGFFSGGKKYPVHDILRGLIRRSRRPRRRSRDNSSPTKSDSESQTCGAATTTIRRVGPVEAETTAHLRTNG